MGRRSLSPQITMYALFANGFGKKAGAQVSDNFASDDQDYKFTSKGGPFAVEASNEKGGKAKLKHNVKVDGNLSIGTEFDNKGKCVLKPSFKVDDNLTVKAELKGLNSLSTLPKDTCDAIVEYCTADFAVNAKVDAVNSGVGIEAAFDVPAGVDGLKGGLQFGSTFDQKTLVAGLGLSYDIDKTNIALKCQGFKGADGFKMHNATVLALYPASGDVTVAAQIQWKNKELEKGKLFSFDGKKDAESTTFDVCAHMGISANTCAKAKISYSGGKPQFSFNTKTALDGKSSVTLCLGQTKDGGDAWKTGIYYDLA